MSQYPKGPSAAFHDAHGGDCIQISAGEFRGYLVYSDGAVRERSAYGSMEEPPSDPLALAKVQLAYREELLRRAMEDFDQCKANLLSLANTTFNGQPLTPPDSEIERLNRLQDVARLRRTEYEAAQKRVEEATPAHIKRRASEIAGAQARNDDFIAAVKRLKV